MLVRTISIQNNDQEILTAAVLCSFAIPTTSQNFLVYSMNEEINETDARVYITSLLKADDRYTLSASIPDQDWQLAMRVFSQIIKEAATGKQQTSETPYHFLDLSNLAIGPAALKEHRSFSIEKDWIVKLLGFHPTADSGPAFESDARALVEEVATTPVSAPPCIEDQEPTTEVLPQPLTHQAGQASSLFDIPNHEAEHFLEDVQISLEAFSNIALRVIQQKQQTLTQQASLESRTSQLEEKELLFSQKLDQLLQDQQRDNELREQQRVRESALDAREEALQRKSEELSEQLKQLVAVKGKLSNILKEFDIEAI